MSTDNQNGTSRRTADSEPVQRPGRGWLRLAAALLAPQPPPTTAPPTPTTTTPRDNCDGRWASDYCNSLSRKIGRNDVPTGRDHANKQTVNNLLDNIPNGLGFDKNKAKTACSTRFMRSLRSVPLACSVASPAAVPAETNCRSRGRPAGTWAGP